MIDDLGIRLRESDGEPLISLEMFGRLCGIEPTDALAEFERQAVERGRRDAFNIPQSWKRGCKEIQARYGTNDFGDLVAALKAEGKA